MYYFVQDWFDFYPVFSRLTEDPWDEGIEGEKACYRIDFGSSGWSKVYAFPNSDLILIQLV